MRHERAREFELLREEAEAEERARNAIEHAEIIPPEDQEEINPQYQVHVDYREQIYLARN